MQTDNSLKTVVGLGEALFDVFPQGRKIGRAPANFAYHATQMGCRGVAVSAVGRDELGDEIEQLFTSMKLDHILQRSERPTGTVQVTVDAAGVPAYEIKEDVAWDSICFDDSLAALARQTDCVCFGSLAQRQQGSRQAIAAFLAAVKPGALKVFDINLRQHFYSKELIEASLGQCNILKINDEEFEIVSDMFDLEGTIARRAAMLMERFSLKALILTCGAECSYVFDATGEVSHIATPRVEVVDTVGAGDSFTGAFCASLLRGLPVAEAHRRAVDVSAYVCTCAGAMPELPGSLRG